jgi:hypothetical protein
VKPLIRCLLLACAATLAAGVLAAFGYRFYLQRTAAALLADVKALKIGKPEFSDAQRIAEKYRRFRIYGNASVPASFDASENIFPEHACVPERCFFEFVIDNRLLSSLHLARGAAFTAAFAVLHGKVEYSEVHIVGGPYPGVFGAFVQETDVPRDYPVRRVFDTPIGKPYLYAKITPTTPAVIREHVFAMNLGCLLAATGCDKPCDYLPLAWDDWKAELGSEWVSALRTSYPKCP